MSPEQATADQNVDHRSDIYAVGAMAYELLTGRPPFQAATPQGVLAAQVTEAAEPVSKHRDQVSPELEVLVMKCLAKKPADRWQSSDEMLPVLEGLTATSGGMTPVQTRPLTMAGTRNRNMVLIAAALVGAGVVAAAGFLLRGPDAEAPPAIDTQVTFRGDVHGWPALSRDDRIIAYRVDGGRSLMVQDLAGGGSNMLVSLDDPGFTMGEPYWSPDDSRLFFELRESNTPPHAIASVPRLGGPLRTEVDLRPLRFAGFSGFGASGEYLIRVYGADVTWIYQGTAPRTLRWVSEDSLAGDGVVFNVAEAGTVWILLPSPDGRWLAYSSVGQGIATGLISTDGTGHTVLAEGMSDVLTIPLGWSPASDAVYYPGFGTQRTEILSLPIDPARGTRAGEPVVVIRGLETGWEHMRSDSTTLIYAGGSFNSNVKVIDLTDAPQATEHPTVMLTRGTATNMLAGLGADGEAAVFQRWTGRGEGAEAGAAEIYTQPTRGGVERLVVRRSGGSIAPLEMSPDGRRVAYYEWGAGKRSTLVIVDLATGDATEQLLGAGLTVTWSADGHRLATSGFALTNRVIIVDLRDSTEVVVELQCDTVCSLQAERAVFSPDGSRIAFSDDFGDGLWIAELADGHATQVAEGAVWTLGWTEDGVYYLVEETGPSGDSYPVIYRVAPQGGTPQRYAELSEDCDIEDVALSIDASTAVCGVIDWKPDVHIVENFDGAGRR